MFGLFLFPRLGLVDDLDFLLLPLESEAEFGWGEPFGLGRLDRPCTRYITRVEVFEEDFLNPLCTPPIEGYRDCIFVEVVIFSLVENPLRPDSLVEEFNLLPECVRISIECKLQMVRNHGTIHGLISFVFHAIVTSGIR